MIPVGSTWYCREHWHGRMVITGYQGSLTTYTYYPDSRDSSIRVFGDPLTPRFNTMSTADCQRHIENGFWYSVDPALVVGEGL